MKVSLTNLFFFFFTDLLFLILVRPENLNPRIGPRLMMNGGQEFGRPPFSNNFAPLMNVIDFLFLY